MKETTHRNSPAPIASGLNWAVQRGYLRTMPDIEMPKRAEGITQTMRGRAITGEELDRMIAKVPSSASESLRSGSDCCAGSGSSPACG